LDNSESPRPITIDDPDLLFKGEYKRSGHDLLIKDERNSLIVYDYFRSDKRSDLRSPEGALLQGNIVEILAGPPNPGEYAQSVPASSGAKVIGRIEKVSGSSTATRNGAAVVLNTGDLVYENDAVQTSSDGSLGISFLDGTAFSLSANARMVLNRMVYDGAGSPHGLVSLASNSGQNSSLMTLVQGKISFVAGQIAKTGDMKVNTPVGTIGIRGTAVHVDMESSGGVVTLSLMREPDGHVGVIQLYSLRTGQPIRTITSADIKTLVTPQISLEPRFETIQKSPAEIAAEGSFVAEVFKIQALHLQAPIQKQAWSSGADPQYAVFSDAVPNGAGSIGSSDFASGFQIPAVTSPTLIEVAALEIAQRSAVVSAVSVVGTPTQGQTLTVSRTLSDPDGAPPNGITYQWFRGDTPIADATKPTYTLTQADVGQAITVKVNYPDQQNTTASTASPATAPVENVNDAPTGAVTVLGSGASGAAGTILARQGETLTLSNTLVDEDGILAGAISYQWFRGTTAIDGATSSSYTLTQADVGQAIRVTARYTDGQGTAESVTSTATAAVANINDPVTGSVTISGTPTQSETLTATQTLADADGLGPVSYQWQRDDVAIDGATSSTYTLTQDDVGAVIRVVASYTDQQGTVETVLSLETAVVEALPQARDDSAYAELGASLTIKVAANDTDADGDLNAASTTIVSGPSLGTAVVNADGTVTYADQITNLPAPSDQSATDTFVYQISDSHGNVDQATVQVNVVDPLSDVQADTAQTANGQTLSLTVATEDRTANASSFVNVDISIGSLGVKEVNIAFVFDASVSIAGPEYAQQIAVIQSTINQLRSQFSGALNDVSVSLIRFASDAQRSATYDLNDAALNDIKELSITAQSGGSTNYEAALQRTLAFFDERDPGPKDEANFVFFTSDGAPTNPTSYLDEAALLKQAASVSAVGFGSQAQLSPLNVLDNTGGAQVVPNAGALGPVFATSPLFSAFLVDFELTLSVNSGPPTILVNNISDLVDNGDGTYSFDLASVAGLLGRETDQNVFEARAVFDTDGDLSTTADRLTLGTVNNVQGAVPDLLWMI
jgi:hypothetical protein